MEGHLPGIGVQGLHLEVRLGLGFEGRDLPHGPILVLEAVVFEIVGLHHIHVAQGGLAAAGAVDHVLTHGLGVHRGDLRLVPGYLRLRTGAVGEDGGDGLGQGQIFPHPQSHHRAVQGVRLNGGAAAGAEEPEGLQGFQGVPLEVEQGLVVTGAAAVVLARVGGVVLPGVGAGPAAAELLPLGAALRPVRPGHGYPARLPVEHAHAAGHGGHRGRHVSKLPALALDGEGVGLVVFQLLADGVGAAVPVLGGVGPLGLGHHDLLTVLLRHGLKLRLQVFHHQNATPRTVFLIKK